MYTHWDPGVGNASMSINGWLAADEEFDAVSTWSRKVNEAEEHHTVKQISKASGT